MHFGWECDWAIGGVVGDGGSWHLGGAVGASSHWKKRNNGAGGLAGTCRAGKRRGDQQQIWEEIGDRINMGQIKTTGMLETFSKIQPFFGKFVFL